jgi:hypothetical protein
VALAHELLDLLGGLVLTTLGIGAPENRAWVSIPEGSF